MFFDLLLKKTGQKNFFLWIPPAIKMLVFDWLLIKAGQKNIEIL
jgi:hypothetical protein